MARNKIDDYWFFGYFFFPSFRLLIVHTVSGEMNEIYFPPFALLLLLLLLAPSVVVVPSKVGLRWWCSKLNILLGLFLNFQTFSCDRSSNDIKWVNNTTNYTLLYTLEDHRVGLEFITTQGPILKGRGRR